MLRWLSPLLFASVLAACGGSVAAPAASVPDAGGADSAGAPPDAAAAAEAGAEADAPAQPTTQQKYLFEAGFVNEAWGFTYSGVYVTADGEVYAYSYQGPDASATIPLDPHDGMTEAEVSAKYAASSKLVTTVDQASLASVRALVGAARAGTLLGTFSCADYGERTYVAWLFDPSTATYSPVRLGIDGDNALRSTAPEAATIIDFIAKAGGLSRDCAPQVPVACSGSACSTVSCSNGELSSCSGQCVSPSACDAVPSCAACGSLTCVVDSTGVDHCSGVWGCPPSGIACDCAGAFLCAGGPTWCRGSASQGFRCEKP